MTEGKGRRLRARLPIYPEFLKGGFITSERLLQQINLMADSTGLVRKDYVND
jgi:hypothetical protein